MNLTVIGLGKLGLSLACLQAQHHRVYGIDTNREAVRSINRAVSPIIEPGIDELLAQVIKTKQFTAHTDYSVVTGTDVSLVIVPTPSKDDGAFTSAFVIDAVRQIGKAIRKQASRHVVVICSTVMPGECDGIIRATLEMASQKTVGEEVGLVYSPEFIALGSVIDDMKYPAMTLIGESDPISGQVYLGLSRSITNEHPTFPPHRRMSLTSAEIAKIALNSYVTMKISFANTLGELCENWPDADSTDVAQAIGLDPRVGSQYIRPGGPYGGPCFPRDNRAFALVGEASGVPMLLAAATDEINDRQIDRVVRHLSNYPQRVVGILGLSYKPGTPIIEESFGIKLAEELYRRDYSVKVHDRLIDRKPGLLPENVMWHTDIGQCIGNNIITVIALPDPEIISYFPIVLEGENRHKAVIVDCWDCLPKGPWDATHIIRLGKYLKDDLC